MTAAPAGVRPTSTAPTNQIALLECTARPAARSVSCESTSKSGSANADLVIGGQGQYVNLVSSNVAVTPGEFSFDATIQSLVPQPLATTDGVTPDSGGVKVFFASGPTVTAGTGAISVGNPDGYGAFTASNQPYFKYDGMLSKNQTSGVRTWTLNYDPGVQSFAFKVLVTAAVQHPEGYVNLSADTTVYAATDSAYALPTQTHAFTATAVSAVGRPKSGATITWTSSDPSIATVDGTGTVTGVAPGRVTISAQSDTLVSYASVAICPDLSTVGSTYVTSGAGVSDVCLMAGGATAEYTAVPYNNSSTSSVSLTFKGSGIQAVTGPPSPNLIPSGEFRMLSTGAAAGIGEDVSLSGADAVANAQARLAFEQGLRRGLPARVPSLRRRGSSVSLASQRTPAPTPSHSVTTPQGAGTRLMWQEPQQGSQLASGGVAYTITPGVPAIGDLMNLDVTSSCGGTPDPRVGRVASITSNAIILSDTANPPGGFTTAQYDSIGLEFDTLAYAVDTANFGAPTDWDSNGRVVVFFTRAVNELSPPASSSLTPGYFAVKDLSPTTTCATSNEGEMIYMMVPDPTGVVNSNVRTVSFVRGNTTSQLTHQLEHLINASRRIAAGNALEEPWLDEGLADMSSELVFYRASVGLAPRQNIIVTNLTTGPNASRRVAAFNAYANPNFSLLRGWLQRPDTTGPMFRTSNSLGAKGSLWAFLRYASDRVNGDEKAFWYSLVNSASTGSDNIQQAIGGADPTTWVRDFTMAMYTDDAVAVGTIDAKYTQPSWNFRSLYVALNSSYQLVPRVLTNNTGITLSYSRQASAFLRFGVPANGIAHLTGNSGGSPPPSMVQMTIVRTK